MLLAFLFVLMNCLKVKLGHSSGFVLQVLAGSYLSVGGAITGLIKPGRMSLFGILLLMWGLIRESIMGKSGFAHAKGIHIYPAMYIALISAFFSIRKDVRKIIRTSLESTL